MFYNQGILTKILEIGEQMRLALCSIALVLGSTGLVGCGQSGDLQLVNSPDYDHRAKYLLYSKDGKADGDQSDAPDNAVPASQAKSN